MSVPKVKIIQAAVRVLIGGGIPSLSYESVAAEAGVTRQGVRYHFNEPTLLNIAICDHLASVYRETLISGAASVPGSERLRFFLDFYFDLLD